MTGLQIIVLATLPLVLVLAWMTYDVLRTRVARRKWHQNTAEASRIVNARHPSRHNYYDRDCGMPSCALCQRMYRA